MPKNKKKLLIVSSTYPLDVKDIRPRFVHDLAKSLNDRVDLRVLCPSEVSSGVSELDGVKVQRFRYFFRKFERLTGRGAVIENLKYNKFLYFLVPFYCLSLLFSVFAFVMSGREVIVNAHWILPQGLAAVLAKKIFGMNRVKIILSCHGADLYSMKGLGEIKKWVVSSSDMVFVVSASMRDDCFRLLGSEVGFIKVRSMGVDFEEKFFPSASLPINKKIIFAGRLAEKKGVGVLVRAVKALKDKGVIVQCSIVGDGLEREKIRSMIHCLGVGDQVNMCGAINHEDLPGMLRENTIFVFPSVVAGDGDREGLGLAPIEAMGCGCLVIASDLDTTKDFVTDGETGLLFRQGDWVDLANKIEYAVSNPEEMTALRNAARGVAIKKFSWVAVAKGYLSAIDELESDIKQVHRDEEGV